MNWLLQNPLSGARTTKGDLNDVDVRRKKGQRETEVNSRVKWQVSLKLKFRKGTCIA